LVEGVDLKWKNEMKKFFSEKKAFEDCRFEFELRVKITSQ
jgi:hypothetical protein